MDESCFAGTRDYFQMINTQYSIYVCRSIINLPAHFSSLSSHSLSSVMANSLPLFLFCYCCCLLFLSFPHPLSSTDVHGGQAAGRSHLVRVRSLLPATVCSSSKGSNPSQLEVVHRHGPCSPLKHRRKRSHLDILRQDQSRVAALHRRISQKKVGGSLAVSIPAYTGSSLGAGNYIVIVGLGTPQNQLPLIFDTGSDVTWTQCKPCMSCYQQQPPVFDPSQSSTYRNISCGSSACLLLDSPECSAASTCRYSVLYGDNSQTSGFFVQDTLTLTPSDVIPNFLFGCGDQNNGLFGQTAGLIGLGRGKVSLPSQAAPQYGGVFSYCLPSTSSDTGYLKFGGGAPSDFKFTPMLTDPENPSLYFLNLEAISVGGKQLPIASTVFSDAGAFIDSGTVISRLPPAAYSALRSSFQQMMQGYPAAPAFALLDTCYNFTGYDTVTVPGVALGFGNGVLMDLDFSAILYVASVSQACLAFAPNSDARDAAVIGNVQQKTFSVVYDVPNSMIGFGAGGC